jgi:chromosome segregation ATPase
MEIRMSFLTSRGKAIVTEPTQERVQMREKAIAFGNHIAELEEQLDEARQQIGDLDRRAKMAEAQVAQLTDEKMELRRERDDFQKRWLECQTKLKTAGNIILDAIKDAPEERYRPKPQALRAVEKALATRQSMESGVQGTAEIPAFLQRSDEEPRE